VDLISFDGSLDPEQLRVALPLLAEFRGQEIEEALASLREFMGEADLDAFPPLHRLARWDEVASALGRLPTLEALDADPIPRVCVSMFFTWPGALVAIAATPFGDTGFEIAAVHCWPGENGSFERLQPFFVFERQGSTVLVLRSDYEAAQTSSTPAEAQVRTFPITDVRL